MSVGEVSARYLKVKFVSTKVLLINSTIILSPKVSQEKVASLIQYSLKGAGWVVGQPCPSLRSGGECL